jgi:hypothetical protein
MTQLNALPVPAEIEAAVGRTITDLGAAFSGVLVNMGHKLGLYKAMAEIGACTPEQLAEATGVRGGCRGGEFESARAVVLCGFGDGVHAELAGAGSGISTRRAGGRGAAASRGAPSWVPRLEAGDANTGQFRA